MSNLALLIATFPCYTLHDAMRLPVLEANYLLEQASYMLQIRNYQWRLSALSSTLKL